MKIYEILVPDLQQEVALTEKFLRRVPEEKFDWRPHPKSMTMKELVNHLAEIPSWITGTMEMDEMEMSGYKSPSFDTIDQIVQSLKNNASEAEAAMKKPDEEYQKNWKMLKDGEPLLEMSKLDVLRTMVMNQLPHHRAQLGVYLRLLDMPVPASYGPSADEN
ncbi:MAG: DinB family protein [Salegentibacter sp.]